MYQGRKRQLILAIFVALTLCASEALAAAPSHVEPDWHLNNALVTSPDRLNNWTPLAIANFGGDGTPLAISQILTNGATLCASVAFAAATPSTITKLCLDGGMALRRDGWDNLLPVPVGVGDGIRPPVSPIWTSVALSVPVASAETSSQGIPDLRPDNPPIPPLFLMNIWAPVSAAAPGGNGTWSLTSSTWTDSNGDALVPMSSQLGFAHFQGTPGTVTVDDSAGDVSVTGMEFAVDGYTLTGDTLTLVPGFNSVATIYVGDDVFSGAVYTATINNTLVGNANVTLMGPGTLVLAGDNTYTGRTVIAFGTLQLGNGGTSGSIVGDVVDESSLVFNRSDAVTYGGVISSSGNVTQMGAGTLTLTGENTYTGGTTIATGSTLALAGSGSVQTSSGVWVDGNFDISNTALGFQIHQVR